MSKDIILENIQLEYFNLSVRAKNALIKNGISKISHLLEVSDDELSNIRNLGVKTCNQIIDLKNRLKILEYNGYDITNFIEEITQSKQFEKLKIKTLKELRSQIIFTDNIRAITPKKLENTGLIELVIEHLIDENELKIYRDQYKPIYRSIQDFLKTLDNKRNRAIIKHRLNGHTLEECGQLFNLTRERVRQIQNLFFSKTPRVIEDKYIAIFKKYNWQPVIFTEIFEESFQTYYYLEVRYKRGGKDLRKLINDPSIDKRTMDHAKLVLLQNDISGKDQILNHVLKTYCINPIKSDTVKILYYKYLERYNLHHNKSYLYAPRFFTTTLTNRTNIIWQTDNKLRYYDTSVISGDELFNMLELHQYKNIDMSTLVIYDKYPEIMKKLDMRDHYELHNLIRKVINLDKHKITMSRNPTIIFGKANRDKQMINLLAKNTPILKADLARKYESKYGVEFGVIMANYLNCLEKYKHKNRYDITKSILK